MADLFLRRGILKDDKKWLGVWLKKDGWMGDALDIYIFWGFKRFDR